MLVYTNAYVTAEEAASRPINNARIGYHSWLRGLTASAVTVSSEDPNSPRDMPLIPDTAQSWKPLALPATWVVDMGAGRDVDYVGIAAHTLGSSDCAVQVQTSDGSTIGSPEDQVWRDLAIAKSPGDDAPMLFLDTSRTCRYVKIIITGGSVMPRIGSVYAGQILAMERMIYGGHAPMALARDTVLLNALSQGGQFLGQNFRRQGQVGQASFRYLSPDWYRTYFDPFVRHARRRPFFFAWRPGDYPLEVAYAWCTADIRPSNMGVQGFMQVQWDMHGIGFQSEDDDE